MRHQKRKATAVVIMPVGKNNIRQRVHINLHLFRIAKIRIGVPGVKENFLCPVLNIYTESGLTKIILIDIGVVIHKNCKFHTLYSVVKTRYNQTHLL